MDRHYRPEGLGPWLWLLCGILAIWGPLGLALEASRALAGMLYGDAQQVVALMVRVALTGRGIAAALSLVRRHRAGLMFARLYLAGSAAFALARAATPLVPSSLAPSDEWIRFTIVALHTGGVVELLVALGPSPTGVRRIIG